MLKDEVIKRINSNYVSDDCVLVMIPYKNCITLMNDNGIMYHARNGSSFYINKYLDDDRRFVFPYSNIPVHCSRVGLFKKNWYTNQILEFEKPYIRILDDSIIESFVVKDGKEALLIDKKIIGNKRSEFKTREELESYLGSNNLTNEDVYFLFLDGGIVADNNNKIIHNLDILSENDIYLELKTKLKNDFNKLKECIKDDTLVDIKFYNNPLLFRFIEQQIDNLDINNINMPVFLNPNNETFIMIKINGNSISIQFINIYFIMQNKYRLDIVDVPVLKYTLEQLKYVSKINYMKEPSISLRLNPGVTINDKKKAKKKVRKINS